MMSRISSLSIAVIGAGAAGLYIADQLMCTRDRIHIDIIDAHPAPIGTAAYRGPLTPVSTDSLTITHLIGNVIVGEDLTMSELTERYDAVIDTTTLGGATEFTLNAFISMALSTARARNTERSLTNDFPTEDLVTALQESDVPATRWLNPLNLPTGRSLEQWHQAIATAAGIPVCV